MKTKQTKKREVCHHAPLIITIKNLTDEKFYDLSVINHEHEKQKKISYECPIFGISYNSLLMKLQDKTYNIDKTMFISYCGYEKFRQKQLQTPWKVKETKANGDAEERFSILTMDPYQSQSDRVINDKKFDLNPNTDVKLSYLMPETEITIRFYFLED